MCLHQAVVQKIFVRSSQTWVQHSLEMKHKSLLLLYPIHFWGFRSSLPPLALSFTQSSFPGAGFCLLHLPIPPQSSLSHLKHTSLVLEAESLCHTFYSSLSHFCCPTSQAFEIQRPKRDSSFISFLKQPIPSGNE